MLNTKLIFLARNFRCKSVRVYNKYGDPAGVRVKEKVIYFARRKKNEGE